MSTDAQWLIKHAALHGEMQEVLRHLDKNMDELSNRIDKNTARIDIAVGDISKRLESVITFRTACREEVLRELTTLKTTIAIEATAAARAETKKWSIIVVIISTILGLIGGAILTMLTGGAA